MNLRTGELVLDIAPPSSEMGESKAAVSESPSFLDSLRLKLKSDEELMRLLQCGEADALAILFRRHSPLVFRIAYRIVRDEAEAEDTVQQIFFDLFRSAERFDTAKGSFKTWLLMFAYHRAFNKQRHLRANKFYDSHEIEGALPEFAASLPSAEMAVLVRQSLERIQPRQRRTIELVYYEGMTAEEISTLTGETVSVVRHNLYRGLERLRLILGSAHKEQV